MKNCICVGTQKQVLKALEVTYEPSMFSAGNFISSTSSKNKCFLLISVEI